MASRAYPNSLRWTTALLLLAAVACGQNLYISDGGLHAVVKYNSVDGESIFIPTGTGGLYYPTGVTFGPDGNLYVGNSIYNQVLRYNGQTGAFIDVFVSANSGGLNHPYSLKFGPDGNLYVTSDVTSQVLKYDGHTGAFLSTFVDAGSGGYTDSGALIFGADGNLYVTSFKQGTSQVLRFDGHTGAFIDVFVPTGTFDGAYDLVFGPNGNLFVPSNYGNSVYQYDGHTGNLINLFVPPGSGGLNDPVGLAFGPDGNLYISNFTPIGNVLVYDGQTGGFLYGLNQVAPHGAGTFINPVWMVFGPNVAVKIASTTPGLTFSVSGTGCSAGTYVTPQTLNWTPGSSCGVSFSSTISGGTGVQYLFNGWADNANAPDSRTFATPSASTTYTANFTTQYLLTTSSSPSAGGSVSGGGWYNAGANATVSASPSTGYTLSSWTGATSSGANSASVVMNAPTTATANFTAQPDLGISMSFSPGHFSQGQNGDVYSIQVTNLGPGPTTGKVTVTETLPAGLQLVSMSGNGWSCTSNVCMRSDALPPTGSYPSISATVNVSPAAGATVANSASVSTAGDYNATNDSTTQPVTVNPISDISSQVSVTTNGFGRNRATGIWAATMTVTNNGGAVGCPVQVVFTNLPPTVSMSNNTGIRNGMPYLTVSQAGLGTGAAVSLTIEFTNPTSGYIGFTPLTDCGVF